jgi:hypothetical protein
MAAQLVASRVVLGSTELVSYLPKAQETATVNPHATPQKFRMPEQMFMKLSKYIMPHIPSERTVS